MQNSNEHTIGELINEFYEQHKGPEYVHEVAIIQSWPKIVGSFIASHTVSLYIRRGVLFVRVDSDSLRNELGYSKSVLLKKLNEAAGCDVLTEIVFN